MIGGRRAALVAAMPSIGEEVTGSDVADVYADTLDVMLTRREVHGLTVAQVRARATPADSHGVYISAVTRLDSTIPALPGTELHRGDVLTLIGAAEDVQRGAAKLGYVVRATLKTDFVFLGIGVIFGDCRRALERAYRRRADRPGHRRRLFVVRAAVRLDSFALSRDRFAAFRCGASAQGFRAVHVYRRGRAGGRAPMPSA